MSTTEIIEALKPHFKAIHPRPGCCEDLQINLSKPNDGAWVVECSAWGKSSRIKAPELEALPKAVHGFDSAAERRKQKLAQIADLQAEVEALGKEEGRVMIDELKPRLDEKQ